MTRTGRINNGKRSDHKMTGGNEWKKKGKRKHCVKNKSKERNGMP